MEASVPAVRTSAALVFIGWRVYEASELVVREGRMEVQAGREGPWGPAVLSLDPDACSSSGELPLLPLPSVLGFHRE